MKKRNEISVTRISNSHMFKKVMFVVRSLKEKLVINLESLLLHGNEDVREQILKREEKMKKSQNKAHMTRRGKEILGVIKIGFLVLFLTAIFYGLYFYGLEPLLDKLQSILLRRGVRCLFFRLLGWGWKGAALFHLITHSLEGVFSGNLTLYVGCDGASSSKRPSIDLNLPPADETEQETTEEPPQEEKVLRREMEEHIFRRLTASAPPGTTPEQLLAQARETASLKRKIIDRMPALDQDHSEFWRTHRYGLITDSLLSNRQNEYAPKHLQKMLDEVNQESSDIYKKMKRIRHNFQTKGTYRC